jgi:acyl carrier protein
MSTEPINPPTLPAPPRFSLGAHDIEVWLVRELADLLGIGEHEIDIHEPFASYGLSSIATVSFSGRLEDWLGIELSPTLAWDYPTIEALAAYLADRVAVAGA